MKTRIVTLEKNGRYATLIGCCHIGSKAYFEELRRQCGAVVLFEGTARPEDPESMLTKVYKLLASTVDLYYQKDVITYESTWIQCDTPEKILTFLQSKTFKHLNDLMSKMSISTIEDGLVKHKHIIKFIFRYLIPMLSRTARGDKVLINFRNNKVLLDVVKYMEAGDSVSVLYGEAHLKDLISRLKQLKFKVVSIQKISVF